MKIKVKKRGGRGGPELKYLSTCSFLFLGPQQSRSAESLPEPELRLHKILLFPLPRLHNFFFPHLSLSSFPNFSDITSWCKISRQKEVKTPHWGSVSLHVFFLTGAHSDQLGSLCCKKYSCFIVSCLTSLFSDKNVKVIVPSARFLCLLSPSPSAFWVRYDPASLHALQEDTARVCWGDPSHLSSGAECHLQKNIPIFEHHSPRACCFNPISVISSLPWHSTLHQRGSLCSFKPCTTCTGWRVPKLVSRPKHCE